MFLNLPHRDRLEAWHSWFAWHPVRVRVDLEGREVMAWFETLERKWVVTNPHNWLDDGGHWEYLLPKGWESRIK